MHYIWHNIKNNYNISIFIPDYTNMGKITTWLNTMTLATGNTVATPFRRWGEIVHALANIPRQGCSSVKNIAEVNKQTWDALVDNFLNFSKVQGK